VAAGLLIFGAYVLWDDTRQWGPLSVQVQISPGAIVRKDFAVNVSAPYTINIEAQKKIDFDTLNCLLGMRPDLSKKCPTGEVIESQWTVAQGETVVASGSSSGYHGGNWASDTVSRQIGRFDGERYHTYRLEVKFLNDGSALDETDPHLVVAVDSDPKAAIFQFALVLLVCAVLVLIGCSLLVASAVVRLRHSPPGTSGPHP